MADLTKSTSRLDYVDPSGSAGGLVTIAAAAIGLLIAFGIPLTPEQETQILRFIAVAGPALTAWLIRRRAYAPATVTKLIAGEVDPTPGGDEIVGADDAERLVAQLEADDEAEGL